MNAAVLIPAYCPDPVLTAIAAKLVRLDVRVIVVDDGSGCSFRTIFSSLKDTCIVLHHEENRGKGEAIRTGLRYIRRNLPDVGLIGVMDADGQHAPEDMARVLICGNRHPWSLILGCRDVARMPFRSQIGNRLTRTVFSRLYRLKLTDTQTGMRAFSRDFIPLLLSVEGSRYEYEMNVLIAAAQQGIPVEEVPIRTIYRDRKNSTSHFRVIRDSLLVFRKTLLFALSSLSGFLIDYGLFVALTLLLPGTALFILTANILARIISGFCNYNINCRLVFHGKRNRTTAAQYALLAAGILLMNNVFLTLYSQAVGIPVYPAKILTEMTLFVISWLIQSRWIFHDGRRTGRNGNQI